jgi:hypothetical protein
VSIVSFSFRYISFLFFTYLLSFRSLGNNPSTSVKGSALCYAVVPNSSPSNETIAPTARPTHYPTRIPTAVPSAIPSHVPTAIPTFSPTSAPTAAPFWVANQYVILGVGVPAVAGFIPIFFSKQICFYALEHWSVTNRRRGLLKITIYTGDSFCVSCLLSSYFLVSFCFCVCVPLSMLSLQKSLSC